MATTPATRRAFRGIIPTAPTRGFLHPAAARVPRRRGLRQSPSRFLNPRALSQQMVLRSLCLPIRSRTPRRRDLLPPPARLLRTRVLSRRTALLSRCPCLPSQALVPFPPNDPFLTDGWGTPVPEPTYEVSPQVTTVTLPPPRIGSLATTLTTIYD